MLDILKSYLRNEEYYIILYSNYLYVYNYEEIIKFSDKFISLKLKNMKANITGYDMLITKMEKHELLIRGTINNVEKIYE